MPKYDNIGNVYQDITLSDIPNPIYGVDNPVGGYHDISVSDIPLPIYPVAQPDIPVSPANDIQTKLKTFYSQNKGLSLLLVAGAAYFLLKDK